MCVPTEVTTFVMGLIGMAGDIPLVAHINKKIG